MKYTWFRHFTASLVIAPLVIARLVIVHLAGLLVLTSYATAQNPAEQRWYQIEVTLFAYDNAMQIQEHWPMEVLAQPLPRSTRPLDFMTDVLTLPEWQPGYAPFPDAELSATTDPAAATQARPDALSENSAADNALPEYAMPLRESDFRLPDTERDAFLALPVSAHGFTDTNRALASAGNYRVLYHNAWRQPLTGANQATPIWVTGGSLFGERHELEGSLTVRFNPGQDRVVLDAKLWLTQFSAEVPVNGAEVRLPDLPAFIAADPAQAAAVMAAPAMTTNTRFTQTWYPAKVIPVINSREMRSNEFHYIDHPAVGILIHVSPYTVPALPVDTGALL